MSANTERCERKNMNRTKLRKCALTIPFAAASAFFGCSAEMTHLNEEVETKDQALLAGECEELGETINTHTCLHGFSGPIVSIDSSDPDVLYGIHNYQQIELDGSGPYSRTLTFTPRNNLPGGVDDFAIYFDPGVTVTVLDDNHDPVASQLSGTIASCDSLTGQTGLDLTGYEVFELSLADAPYEITFTSAVQDIGAAVEELKENAEWWWYDNDADGYGPSPTNRIKTACAPWAPYTAKQWGDCNDANASVYPGNGC